MAKELWVLKRWKPVSVSEEAGQEGRAWGTGPGSRWWGRMWEERAHWCPALQQELADPEKETIPEGLGDHKAAVRNCGGAPRHSPFPLPHPKDVYMRSSRASYFLHPHRSCPKLPQSQSSPALLSTGTGPLTSAWMHSGPPRPPLLTEEEFKVLSWLCSFSLESFFESQRQRTAMLIHPPLDLLRPGA